MDMFLSVSFYLQSHRSNNLNFLFSSCLACQYHLPPGKMCKHFLRVCGFIIFLFYFVCSHVKRKCGKQSISWGKDWRQSNWNVYLKRWQNINDKKEKKNLIRRLYQSDCDVLKSWRSKVSFEANLLWAHKRQTASAPCSLFSFINDCTVCACHARNFHSIWLPRRFVRFCAFFLLLLQQLQW